EKDENDLFNSYILVDSNNLIMRLKNYAAESSIFVDHQFTSKPCPKLGHIIHKHLFSSVMARQTFSEFFLTKVVL
ncbi:unnamed protein product, partial [Rotaria magnacalcarata]